MCFPVQEFSSKVHLSMFMPQKAIVFEHSQLKLAFRPYLHYVTPFLRCPTAAQ